MSVLTFTRRPFRLAFYAAILLVPAWTLWNLIALNVAPQLAMRVGPRLEGVVRALPLEWSWSAIKKGELQKAVASRVAEAFPFHRILVRINNEIRAKAFGEVTAPGVVRGRGGQLVETFYIDAYCAITPELAASRARDTIPMLRDLQAYYESRGATFLYVLTPSKVTAMTDAFLGNLPCASSPEMRKRLAGDYVALLAQAGINVLDTANLIYRLAADTGVEMYPRGGAHWNWLGAAHATRRVADELNRRAGRTVAEPFDFTYEITMGATGSDRELVALFNVLFPPLAYPTPKVTYRPSAACATSPANGLDAFIVGSSYMHSVGSLLIEQSCLSKLNMYFYLYEGRFGGVPYRALKPGPLKDEDYEPLRSAQLVIVEENEAFLVRANPYVQMLHKFVMGGGKRAEIRRQD